MRLIDICHTHLSQFTVVGVFCGQHNHSPIGNADIRGYILQLVSESLLERDIRVIFDVTLKILLYLDSMTISASWLNFAHDAIQRADV